MTDFTLGEALEMQQRLQEKYRGKWEPIQPATGKNKLLWMLGEMGEVAEIIKKNGHAAIRVVLSRVFSSFSFKKQKNKVTNMKMPSVTERLLSALLCHFSTLIQQTSMFFSWLVLQYNWL